jgi:hypothetical protein
MMKVRDLRKSADSGIPIKDMPDGTWFTNEMGLLFLKPAHDTCVDVVTGRRVPFNEDFKGRPVEVEINIVKDQVFRSTEPPVWDQPPIC